MGSRLAHTNVEIQAETMDILVRFNTLYNTAVHGRFHLNYHERLSRQEHYGIISRLNFISCVLVGLKVIHTLQNLDSFNFVLLCKNSIKKG